MDLAAALAAVLARLEAAGIRAVHDQRDLNPPAVLVDAPTVAYRFNKGAELTWVAVAVVGDIGALPALKALGPYVDEIRAALAYAPITARPVTVQGVESTVHSMPGYELTWTERI